MSLFYRKRPIWCSFATSTYLPIWCSFATSTYLLVWIKQSVCNAALIDKISFSLLLAYHKSTLHSDYRRWMTTIQHSLNLFMPQVFMFSWTKHPINSHNGFIKSNYRLDCYSRAYWPPQRKKSALLPQGSLCLIY